MKRPGPLVIFSIGAVVDFVFGYMNWHSIGAGLVAIIGGLPLTALLYLGLKSHDDSEIPRS